ncbi:MAG: DUF3592 domain-containing protein [Planctomycetes bacterium]|nr:DUF3592 domain-containing protein [Planctomycetota bacterium]
MGRLDEYNRRPGGSTSSGRNVPLTTQVAIAFGGFFPQFGAAFFTFGMIFWWIFGAQADVTSWYQFSGDLVHVQGQALTCTDTGMSVGGDDDTRGTPVYKTTYGYEVEGGRYYEGECYGTGLSFSPGQVVPVEYVADDPVTSRIEGSRKKPWDAWVLFVAIFPGLGLVFMALGVRSNLRKLRILKVGKTTRGRLVSKEPTNTKINNQTVYKFTFEYQDESGNTHQVSDKTHITHLLEDEDTEKLVYDPGNPANGLLVDVLPGKPKIDDHGNIGASGAAAAFTRAVLPVGGVAAHVAVFVLLYVL